MIIKILYILMHRYFLYTSKNIVLKAYMNVSIKVNYIKADNFYYKDCYVYKVINKILKATKII